MTGRLCDRLRRGLFRQKARLPDVKFCPTCGIKRLPLLKEALSRVLRILAPKNSVKLAVIEAFAFMLKKAAGLGVFDPAGLKASGGQ